MIDSAVRILSLANQLDSARERVRLDFVSVERSGKGRLTVENTPARIPVGADHYTTPATRAKMLLMAHDRVGKDISH
jgi:hypothetical protein